MISLDRGCDSLPDARKHAIPGNVKYICPQFDAQQGISEQALDSGNKAIQPKVDNPKCIFENCLPGAFLD